MYTVPDTVKNIGTFDAEGNLSNQCWGYVGFDKTSYDWNLANLTGCYFIPEQFLVYFTKPDPKQNCGTVQTFKGEGGLWPGISEEIVLGSTTGVVDFWFQSYNVADRFQVWFDGECVIDTGFVGSWTQRTKLKDYLEERLAAGPTNFRPQKGSNDLTYKLTDDTDLDNIIDQYKTQNPNDETDDKNYDDGKWVAGDLGYPGYPKCAPQVGSYPDPAHPPINFWSKNSSKSARSQSEKQGKNGSTARRAFVRLSLKTTIFAILAVFHVCMYGHRTPLRPKIQLCGDRPADRKCARGRDN
jgi:hypothetical protein